MISEEEIAKFTGLLEGLTESDIAGIFGMASPVHLKAGDIYITIDEYSKKLAYIEKGLIRTYAIKDNGDDATLLLRWENQFTGSHDSILLNRPSKFMYQALEDTLILEINYEEVEAIMKENPKYEPLRNFILMSMLGGTLGMIEDFILLTPEERYLKLTAENFDIVNRVPGKYIASMLGITPVSLSRIRKRIAGKK